VIRHADDGAWSAETCVLKQIEFLLNLSWKNFDAQEYAYAYLRKPRADLIWGTRDIGREIGRSERQAFHMLASGILPGAKIGGHWVASRAKLRRHIEALLEDAAA
jgi:hypothetical protein